MMFFIITSVSLYADETAGVFTVQEKDLYPMLTFIFIYILFNPTQHISLWLDTFFLIHTGHRSLSSYAQVKLGFFFL